MQLININVISLMFLGRPKHFLLRGAGPGKENLPPHHIKMNVPVRAGSGCTVPPKCNNRTRKGYGGLFITTNLSCSISC